MIKQVTLKALRYGLCLRLSILTCLMVITGFLILATTIFCFGRHQITKRIEEESKMILAFAQMGLTEPLWSFDNKTMSEVAHSLISEKSELIAAVRLSTSEGKILIETARPEFAKQNFDHILHQPEHHLAEGEIRYGLHKIGFVQLVISPRHMWSDLNELTFFACGLSLLCALVISTLLFKLTRKSLKPLRELVGIAEKFEDGNYQLPPELGWQAEFGTLSNAFSKAAMAIAQRDLELKKHAITLEEQIQLRTHELDVQRMNMVNSSRLASIGEISAGVSHEINNPLTIIEAKVSILKRRLKGDARMPELEVHLDKISQMVQRISNIIRGLRTFARDGAHDQMQYYSVDELIGSLQDLCHARMTHAQIQFKVLAPAGLIGHGREVQISQVLINLINNSIDAVRKLDERWVELRVFERNGFLIYGIKDSGSGIAPEIREKIMLPFFTTKDVGEGTGLGLAISTGIVRDHGGQLSLIEHPTFTCFEASFPQA